MIKLAEYLPKFEKVVRIPTLDGIKYLMKEFGNPHEGMKFIHIAGTNGKGSVCEMINNILVNAGYKTRKIYFTTFDKI